MVKSLASYTLRITLLGLAGLSISHAQTVDLGALSNPPGQSALAPSGAPAAPIPSIRSATSGGQQAIEAVPAPANPAPKEEPRPNEFQKFVFSATGVNLDVFGSSYFATPQPAFSAVERTPVPSDYVIGPGDELYIRAWGMVDIDYRAVVDRNGQINLPKVGTIGVARLKAGEIEDHLRGQIGKVFKSFSLNVTLGQLRSVQIFVVGQAKRPGTYTVSSLATLVNAVFASGGPGPNGSMRRVQLKRGNALVTELDLYDFITRGDKSKDARLQSGDVVVFLPVGPRVALVGAADAPAVYELASAQESLKDLLSYGGGLRATSNNARAQLERIDPAHPKAPRVVQTVDPSQASGMPLRDGDIVTLFGVGAQFANAVTLRGNVAAPLRYPYVSGMRISDLIPERDALVTVDYYLRKNKLVQFLEDGKLKGRTDTSGLTNDVKNIVDEPNWEYATIERLNADRITLSLSAFNLAKAVVEKDPAQNLLLQPGDVVTIFSSKDIKGPQLRGTRLVKVEGEVDRPGVYQLQPGETLRALVARAGGFTPQAYVFGTEFSRESTRARQRVALQDAVRRLEVSLASAGAKQAASVSTTDAAAVAAAAKLQEAEFAARTAQLSRLRSLEPNGRIALELDAAAQRLEDLPDLPLEDGDRVAIPARPGFVFAVGAVANENGLIWRPGRGIKDYLRLAGVTPEADEANIFVVRADGSVVHARDGGNFFGGFGGLSSLALAPGDTVVVPDLLNRETVWTTFIRGAKDWTQIISNLGLGAAAIKTLRQ